MKAINRNRKHSFLATSVVAANLLMGASYANLAMAQGAEEIEEVVVTASFRDSLKKALDVKKSAVGAVDSIMAEDIADFPDTNLAESMQRIPGVAITKEAGEGREITVRGLNSTYTRVMINNAMGQSLAAGSGGVRTSRAFDFNVFASEMFNRLDVHKSQSAELEEGSLGATVNLHTGRPFDYDPMTAVVNVQAAYNEQSSEVSPRASGLFSFTNSDETFGALVSFASAERFVSNQGADTGRWEDDNFGSCTACATDADFAAVKSAWHPRFPRIADKTHDQERTGITGSFQFRPSETTEITFDTLYANLQSTRDEPFMQAISLARTNSTGVGETDVAAYTIDSNNTLVSATMDGVDVRAEAFVSEWESEFEQYALTIDQDFGDRLHVKAMVAKSESVLDNRETTMIYEHYSVDDTRRLVDYAQSASAVTYDFSSMTSPSISYDFDTTNPANWEVSEFRDRVYDASSESDTAKLDLTYDLTDEITLKAGYSSREYTYDIAGTRADRAFTSADGLDGTVDNVACGVTPTVTSSMGTVQTHGGQSFFMAGASTFDAFRANECWPAAVSAGDTRRVVEEVEGYYAQVDFTFGKLRGNAGVRNVTTDLSTTGINSGTTVSVNHSYDDNLPSVNLAYNLTDDVILRASWAKVMSRANLTDLNPGGSVSIFGDYKVNYGNPFIEPFRADNTDLSVEWYFAEGALLSFAYFDKDIESFPSSETTTLSWAETGLPNSLLGSELNNAIDQEFTVSRRINGGGGTLDGYEIQYQQNMTFLPEGWMQNLGLIANLTSVDSEVDASGLPLTGQSDTSYNFTVFYEDDQFSTRLAYSYRGDYISSHNSNVNKTLYRDSAATLDFAASYKVNENLKVTLEGINLTDETVGDYMAPGVGRIISEQVTGQQWMVGASYKF
ncbi:MAG: TonB-dependent receptor [Pseudomonadales bacterium]|nr:TonB-dependent receptor [Pseudomonadales bacterium]MDP4640767.1 TonB-dependent receptor [Pseudomonadales bacterium]MDP4765879.1 TonB-dependent receptor [Pseudomonadales bacterium]MDP4911276.1 TonB-dependent receptor [Pseudomonadales bacterium]MDP5059471.1 TonB-dependent receptor [Pseudomonadales bacterium]